MNWEYAEATRTEPELGSNAYNLSGGRAYVKGIWASTPALPPEQQHYYWYGCIEFNAPTYTSSSIGGTWTQRASSSQHYDAGLLIDDNDTMYVVRCHEHSTPNLGRRLQPGPGPAGLYVGWPASARSKVPGSTSATASTTSG